MLRLSMLGRGIALAGLLGVCLGAQPAAAQTTVADGINHVGHDASTADDWNSPEVGWFYTPSTSYTLKGVQSKFSSNTGNKTVTVEVRAASGNAVGSLLRSGTFNPVAQTFSGATFTDLALTSGTRYFIGFRNVDGVGFNVTDEAGTAHPVARAGSTNSGTYENLLTFEVGDPVFYPILRFMGPDEVPTGPAVPEPASFALFLPALVVVAVAAKRRPRV